jgi:glycosyltransferase involved in cell wall biosynthesis
VRRFYPELDRVELVRLPLALLADEAAAGPQRNVGSVARDTILAAGQAVPQKGFDILMRALTLVPPSVIGAATVVVGHGDADYLRLCESMARTAKTAVAMPGWTARADLVQAMVKGACP